MKKDTVRSTEKHLKKYGSGILIRFPGITKNY